ncbi:MAG: DUF456 family protein [Chthoniobacterales bacterium]
MALFWWAVAIVMMAIGLIGTVLPIVPGTTIILAGAVVHRIMLGAERSVGWGTIAALISLTLVSYLVEMAAGYFGARRFGATKWGTLGAVVGGLVGLFFALPGLIIGPIVGAVAGELIAGKRLVKAGKAGWGTLLGSVAGMIAKLAIGLAMISWFLVAVPSPV